MPGADRLGFASGEPRQLWRVHFRRDLAAHIAQNFVPAGVDRSGIIHAR